MCGGIRGLDRGELQRATFGSANGNRTRILALKGLRANRCTIAPHRINFSTILRSHGPQQGRKICNLLVVREQRVDDSGDRCPQNGRYPEQPKLGQRPATNKQRGPGAARRVHRQVSHGNTD